MNKHKFMISWNTAFWLAENSDQVKWLFSSLIKMTNLFHILLAL